MGARCCVDGGNLLSHEVACFVSEQEVAEFPLVCGLPALLGTPLEFGCFLEEDATPRSGAGPAGLVLPEQACRGLDRCRPSTPGHAHQAPPGQARKKIVDPHVLEIIFQLPDGIEQQLAFTKRPLGLDFDRMSPIVIKKVQSKSEAEIFGVQPGWMIKYVNGEACWSQDFRYQFALLHKYSRDLIDVGEPEESMCQNPQAVILADTSPAKSGSTTAGGTARLTSSGDYISEGGHRETSMQSMESSTFRSGARIPPSTHGSSLQSSSRPEPWIPR